MRTAAEERARWETEWRREGAAAIWGCPDMTWDDGIRRDLAMIVPHLGLEPAHTAVILDLGCGPGRLAVPLAKMYRALPGRRVIGVDCCESVVREARRAKIAARLSNAVFHVGNGRRLPAAVLRVDAAYSMLLFQHLEAGAVRGYLGEVARILKPQGRFRFQWTVGLTNDGYAQDHDPLDMVKWCDDVGLAVEECPEPDPQWPTWGWATATRL